jgi:hypothetical protein
MQRLITAVAMTTMAGAALVLGQAPDAAKVLADMQQALGGSDKVAAVKAMTATGTITRVTPRGTTEGETELALELPDKYMTRTVVGGQGAMAIYRNAGFNGDGLINLTDAPPNLAGAARTRDGLGDRARAPGAAESAEDRAALMARQVLLAKKDFARLLLGMLGSSAPAFPLEFTYGGQAESGDGVAHIVDAKGADNFTVQLFVDTKTHLPLMMMWSDPGAGANAGRMIERRLFYSNFKKVGSLNLPHTVRRSVDGATTEETTYAEITLNPKIDGKKFEISK